LQKINIIVNNVKVNGDRDQYAMTSDVEDAVRKAIVDALSSIVGVSVSNTYDGSPTDEFDVEFVEDGATLTLG
jgi:flagellar hook-associated protein FlgK